MTLILTKFRARGSANQIQEASISHRSRFVLLLYIIMLFASGCSDDNGSAGTAISPALEAKTQIRQSKLVRGLDGEPATLDPHLAGGNVEWILLVDLFEGLVEIGFDGEVLPAGAERWESDDGLNYRFYLREDARWSNGDAVTAHDYVYSWRRLVDPRTASPYASYLGAAGVLHAAKISEGELSLNQLGVVAVNNYVLEVTLERPNTIFPAMLDNMAVFPVHAATVEQYGNDWTKVGKHISNGVYHLHNWVFNERIELQHNRFYWNQEQVSIEEVTFLPLTSATAEIQRYLADELDLTFDLAPDKITTLEPGVRQQLHSSVLPLATRFYNIQTKKPPLDDPRIRKALAYAIDRDVISKKIYGRGERSAYSLVPEARLPKYAREFPWAEWSQSKRESTARRLYAEAGFSTDSPLKVTLMHTDKELSRREAIATAAMWTRILGIDVTLVQHEWKTFIDKQIEGNFDVAIFGWWADYYDPSSILRPLRSTDSSNYGRYSNSSFDRSIAQALREPEKRKRLGLYAEAESILSHDMPVIPIFHYTASRLVKPHVGGYRNHPLDTIRSKNLWIKDISGQ